MGPGFIGLNSPGGHGIGIVWCVVDANNWQQGGVHIEVVGLETRERVLDCVDSITHFPKHDEWLRMRLGRTEPFLIYIKSTKWVISLDLTAKQCDRAVQTEQNSTNWDICSTTCMYNFLDFKPTYNFIMYDLL